MLVALAVVALAAAGSRPTEGEAGVRRPSDTVLDLLFSLYVVAIVLGGVLVVAMLVLRRVAVLSGQEVVKRNPVRSLLVVGLLLVGLLFALRWLEVREPVLTLPEFMPEQTGVEREPLPREPAEQYRAEFAWKPLLALAALLLLGALAWWRAAKARAQARVREPKQTLAERLADVLEETLDSLRAEPDPRRAVIGAYARLERVLAASGLARRPAEAPLEYLGRMLTGLEVGPAPVRRLTALFERAKFSQHAVDEAMKQEAILALESVQGDLRDAEARARQARAEALALERERIRERARA